MPPQNKHNGLVWKEAQNMLHGDLVCPGLKLTKFSKINYFLGGLCNILFNGVIKAQFKQNLRAFTLRCHCLFTN